MSEHGLWLYAVTEWPELVEVGDLSGVGGAPVRVIDSDGLMAVVSDVPLDEFGEAALRVNLEDLAWLQETATAHHVVIDTIARDLAVVPMRLATVYSGEANVRTMLRDRGQDLRDVLRRTSGCREWGIKAFAADEPNPANEIRAASAASSSGAEYLRRRRDELAEQKNARGQALTSAESIHAALSGLAIASRLHPPQAPQLSGARAPMVLNAAYLLDEARDGAFNQAVQRLAEQHPAVQLQVSGPWPPYSFAVLEQVAPERAEVDL